MNGREWDGAGLYSRREAAEALEALAGISRSAADDQVDTNLEARPDGTYWRSDVRELALNINRARKDRARCELVRAIGRR